MKAKYIGDPNLPEKERDIPDEQEAFGITFEKGKFADIEDPAVFRTLEGNPYFETQGKAPEEK